MKLSDDLNWGQLEALYEEGRGLFLKGKYDDAARRFARIYEDSALLRDVEEVVGDYFIMPREEWIAKYKIRFQQKDG